MCTMRPTRLHSHASTSYPAIGLYTSMPGTSLRSKSDKDARLDHSRYVADDAKRHPKVIEDEKAVEVVFRLEEDNQHHSRHGRRPTAAG